MDLNILGCVSIKENILLTGISVHHHQDTLVLMGTRTLAEGDNGASDGQHPPTTLVAIARALEYQRGGNTTFRKQVVGKSLSHTQPCIPLQRKAVWDGLNSYSVARDGTDRKKSFLEGSYKCNVSLRRNERPTLWY